MRVLRLPLHAGVLEVFDQLLFLRIDRDERDVLLNTALRLCRDVLELPVAIRVLLALDRLLRSLQTVAELMVGSHRYPDAREIFITADAGGSNGYRARVWKHELQRLADKLGIAIRVSHFPPGTSKWNKSHLSSDERVTPALADFLGLAAAGSAVALVALLDAYRRSADAERAEIRAEVLRASIDLRYAQLASPDRALEPIPWIERVLLTASICDGYPDPRDHYLAVQSLEPFAKKHAIELGEHREQITRLSSARIQLLFAGRLDQSIW